MASLCLPPVDNRGQTATAARASLGGENKRLKKLGVKLPASAVIETKFKDAGERQVHLFIKVPAAALSAFVKSLDKIPSRQNRRVALASGRIAFGYIPLAGYEGGKLSQDWEKTHSADLKHVGHISLSKRMESKGYSVETDYVVLFADVEKGLMWVYYYSK